MSKCRPGKMLLDEMILLSRKKQQIKSNSNKVSTKRE